MPLVCVSRIKGKEWNYCRLGFVSFPRCFRIASSLWSFRVGIWLRMAIQGCVDAKCRWGRRSKDSRIASCTERVWDGDLCVFEFKLKFWGRSFEGVKLRSLMRLEPIDFYCRSSSVVDNFAYRWVIAPDGDASWRCKQKALSRHNSCTIIVKAKPQDPRP